MATTERGSSPLVSEAAFARTYAARVYDDAYQAVEDYRDVMAYRSEHPNRGRTALGRRFDLPPGRVQSWIEGSRPNPVRGLEVAQDRAWIDPPLHSNTMRGLNILVAWILTRGSITADTWTPFFVARYEDDRAILDAAAELAGVELDFSRSNGDERTQELRPVEAGSVLGRVLYLLGAPRGEKYGEGGLAVPGYLTDGPERLGRDFVHVLLHTLGAEHDSRYVIEFSPRHPTGFIEDVAGLVRRLTGESVSVLDRNVVLSRGANEAVAVWEPLPGVE